jgi:uncharacterized iron-regulated membrane protein
MRAVSRPSVLSVRRLRQLHRYLGLFIGVQFLAWTAGGLYFSWTDLDAIHGDHWVRKAAALPLGADAPLVAPSRVLEQLRARGPVASVQGVELGEVLGEPVWRVRYTEPGAAPDAPGRKRVQLASAVSGALRGPLSREEAVRVAQAGLAHAGVPVRAVEEVTEATVGRHHEYREQPLPAWAVTFEHPSSPTLYVPADVGQVHRVRTREWRLFDWLWMLHTMDYEGRDDFNNLLLRAFSALGLLTILSGFGLFLTTSRFFWGLTRRRPAAPAAPRAP